MDENKNSKIEELKRDPPGRFLPLLVLFVAVAAVFMYRVAVTDPEWNAPAAKAAPASARANAPVTEPAKRTAASTQEASEPSGGESSPTLQRPADRQPSERNSQGAPASAADKVDEAAPKPPAVQGVSPDATNAYLKRHINRSIPFLHKGKTREVTLTAFTHSTITIRHGQKALTLERASLSPEQLELWK